MKFLEELSKIISIISICVVAYGTIVALKLNYSDFGENLIFSD